MTLLVCEADDVLQFSFGYTVLNNPPARICDAVDSLVNIVLFNPALGVEIVDASPCSIRGKRDRTIHVEIGVPEAGRHCHLAVCHVFKDDFRPVYSGHGIVVLGHRAYFLRHGPDANRYGQISLPIGVCNGVVANFMWLPHIGDTNDHAPGSIRVHNEKTPGLPNQREPGAWSHQFRMYEYELHRLKLGGTNAAQTPSSASAPDQIGTLVGADTQEVTATNQSTQHVGGGWHVEI